MLFQSWYCGSMLTEAKMLVPDLMRKHQSEPIAHVG